VKFKNKEQAMRRTFVTAAALAMFASTLSAKSHLIDGLVMKIDEPAAKITIRHGPIKRLEMESPMTMVFRVREPAMLKQVKAGDRIKFEAERVNGQLTVLSIQKAR
jgi:Cu(I)/Ag(I) efflux system periplasmic protein CusF